MIVLLLPVVAAILVFCPRPDRYASSKRPVNDLQTALYTRLEAGGLSGDELASVGALTLGYKEDLDKDLKRHFQAAGAAHILAVSGLHTGIIYALLIGLLTFGGRFKPLHEQAFRRRLLSLIIIAAMWGYAWLTGMTPSVVRAVVMVTIFEFGRMVYRQSFSLNTIASAAVLILLVRPQDLWSVSFQLSFAATAAIVVAMSAYQYRDLRLYRLPKIARYFLDIIVVSFAAQLGTLPITMVYFHQISTYFLLANLLVLPIASVLVPCGLVSIALGGSAIGVLFSKVTWAMAWLMNHSVGWIESLPGSTLSAHINGWMSAVYYLLLVLFFAFLPKNHN